MKKQTKALQSYMEMEQLSLAITDECGDYKVNEGNLTKNSHLRCRYYDTLLILSVVCFPSPRVKNLTVKSMEGLRSNHNGSRGLMNVNDVDDSVPFAAFILSIPLVPGWLVSGKRR